MDVTTGRIAAPPKLLIYGPEGIGKSTFASKFPAPIFLDTECGTLQLDVDRFKVPRTWQDVVARTASLAQEEHGYKTLVIDSLDWAEQLASEYVCRTLGVADLSEVAHGRAYVKVTKAVCDFLSSLDDLRRYKKMTILVLAHSVIAKFELPDQAGQYDRYELDLGKKVKAFAKEWADAVLLCNWKTYIVKDEATKKVKGKGGRERVLYTTHTAAWDAKNRYDMPEELPLDYATVSRYVFAGGPVVSVEEAPEPSAVPEGMDELPE